jgi:hypothetical protein
MLAVIAAICVSPFADAGERPALAREIRSR